MEHHPRPDLATVAALIGQPARASMLSALLSGQWLTGKELARVAGVASSTASEHLTALVAAGLVRRRTSGRSRYHALSGPDVAEALEGLEHLSANSLYDRHHTSQSQRTLRFARTCYDHLAGKLGVVLSETLVERGIVTRTGSDVTPAGESCLRELGVDIDEVKGARRNYIKFCLDWSERRDHLAGAVGAAITDALLDHRWIVRMERTRAVRLTLRGREGLDRWLGLSIEPHQTSG